MPPSRWFAEGREREDMALFAWPNQQLAEFLAAGTAVAVELPIGE
jgi:hypothetical protein